MRKSIIFFLYLVFPIATSARAEEQERGVVCAQYASGGIFYLFGTMHNSPFTFDLVSKGITKFIEGSGKLMVESTDPIDLTPEAYAAEFDQYPTFGEVAGKGVLDEIISNSKFFLKRYPENIPNMRGSIDNLFWLIFWDQSSGGKLRHDTQKLESEDKFIVDIARKNNIEVFGLETTKEVIGQYIKASADYSRIRGMLRDAITCSHQESCLQRFLAYQNNRPSVSDKGHITDYDRLRQIWSDFPVYSEFNLVDERTEKFFTRIKHMPQAKGPVFIGIGANHLGGPKGLIAHFRNDGAEIIEGCLPKNK